MITQDPRHCICQSSDRLDRKWAVEANAIARLEEARKAVNRLSWALLLTVPAVGAVLRLVGMVWGD